MQLEEFSVPASRDENSNTHKSIDAKKKFNDFFITGAASNFGMNDEDREQIRTVQTRRTAQRQNLSRRTNERLYLQRRACQLSMDSKLDSLYGPRA